jgi:hypothetical protein
MQIRGCFINVDTIIVFSLGESKFVIEDFVFYWIPLKYQILINSQCSFLLKYRVRPVIIVHRSEYISNQFLEMKTKCCMTQELILCNYPEDGGANPSETSVTSYQSTRSRILTDFNLQRDYAFNTMAATKQVFGERLLNDVVTWSKVCRLVALPFAAQIFRFVI